MSPFEWFLVIAGVVIVLGALSWIFDISGGNGDDA